MRRIIIIAVLVTLAGAVYYFRYYPPVAFERRTERALNDFSDAVASKDRSKIGHVLDNLLESKTQISLEVSIFHLVDDGAKPIVQNFDKQSFIAFVDNILYTLTDYEFTPSLQSFALSPDHKTAQVTFTAKEWADGPSYYGGVSIDTRFSADTTCDAHVLFDNARTTLDKLDCKMQLRMVPKPGEAAKIQQNPEALKQLLH